MRQSVDNGARRLPPQLDPGTVEPPMTHDDPLRRYQIMEPLGAGQQGSTFVAIDRQSGQRVAVKVLSLGSVRDWRAFERFEREISTLKSLRHPGIPKYLDSYASEPTGEYFLVMSLAPGVSLNTYVGSEKTLSPSQLLQTMEQVLDTLEYLHDRTPPIIHRDIKPANLVLSDEGRVCLVDFGGVRRALDSAGAATVIGTIGYMPPEQAQGELKPISDIYALGATIAALAANMEPEELPREGLALRLPHNTLNTRWRDVLIKMLAPDPRQRYQSARDVKQALEACAGDRKALGESAKDPSLEPVQRVDLELADTIGELKKAPRPILAVVWVLAAISAGFLFVAEAGVIPLVYQLIRACSSDKDKPRLATQHEELKARIRFYRRALSTLSQSAEQIRDENDHPTRRR
ncbi:MAG: serine/threonine-protein kinase [Nannocystaceae bacterium]